MGETWPRPCEKRSGHWWKSGCWRRPGSEGYGLGVGKDEGEQADQDSRKAGLHGAYIGRPPVRAARAFVTRFGLQKTYPAMRGAEHRLSGGMLSCHGDAHS